MPNPDLNSLADQLQALTKQVTDLHASQKLLAGDLNRRFEQLNKVSGIVDMKVAFTAGREDFDVDENPVENLGYHDSPIKTTHAGVIAGDMIFMIAMVYGRNDSGGPAVARGRIIRTSSPGFDVFGTEEPDLDSCVTFARQVGQIAETIIDESGEHPGIVGTSPGDAYDGGTLMIAATADAAGTYDCRVQITQLRPGSGSLQLQHMMSLVFRPGT